MTTGIGAPLLRKEDSLLLIGEGAFSDDMNLPGQAFAVMVRSPHAHAVLGAIAKDAALAIQGVLAVLTGSDLLADGLNPVTHLTSPNSPPDIKLENRDGSDIYIAPHFPLPADRARFVGEAVAMVIAETVDAARDGAEAVVVEYEVLPSVTGTAAAAEDGATCAWPDAASNVSLDSVTGDEAATEAAFAAADHVVRLATWIQRVTGVPMEPRAAIGDFDGASGRYTLHAGSGGVVRQKRELAGILGIDAEKIRVVAHDVGGNFGTRNAFYPEFALVVWAAKRLGRPVKWTADRSEAFLSDHQGRDLAVEAELALESKGKFLALRASLISNLGAHTVSLVPLTKGVEILTGIYAIPCAHVRGRAVLSNTPPTNPYRSAGRPEVMFVMERLVDLAARTLGVDPEELRRRNLIPLADMPYPNPLGMIYDNCDYGLVMDMALDLADRDGIEARRGVARSKGRLLGFGIANYVETSTGAPRERTEITVLPEGRVDVVIGTLSSGQGHETSFAQLVTEWLGVPAGDVRLITGDTDLVPVGGGSHSGRSMRMAGIVMGKASADIAERGRRIAAHVLEAAEADISFADGVFTVAGTDRSLGIFDVAAAAADRADLPQELQGPLTAISDEVVQVPAYPYGCHVCEVEVDPETGFVEITRYGAVDDVGRAINPLILHGQTHGSAVQGLGQALLEDCSYDAETGQMLAASFMDYAMPRADQFPSFHTALSEVPAPTNPLGIRAGGEGGTTPALAVLVNAIVDALADLGVRHVEMPATPERVWRAIQDTKAKSLP